MHMTDGGGWSSGQYLQAEITLNDVIIVDFYIKPNTAYNDQMDFPPVEILIPPFTNFVMEADSNIDSNHNVTMWFVGDVQQGSERIQGAI
jgi:hypothetical protein